MSCWKKSRVFVVCLLGVAANFWAGGCSRRSHRTGEVALTCTFEVHPRIGPTAITCKLTGAAQAPITGARVSLEADMSHAGMSPVLGEGKEISPGTYTGTLDLNMRGDWVVTAHVVLPDGQKLNQEMKIGNLQAN